MSKQRDRAWRRAERERHIRNRVEADLVPAVDPVHPTAIWQLHTPDGVPMPVFRREAGGPSTVKRVGQTLTVKMQHAYGCPRYESKYDGYIPHGPGCTEHCGLRPGPGVRWYHESWPAAPIGFVWRLVRFTDPQQRGWAVGKLAKWRRPKGTWFFRSASGRSHAVSTGERKNWKLLYTRSVKVKRAQQLGFEYGRIRRFAHETED